MESSVLDEKNPIRIRNSCEIKEMGQQNEATDGNTHASEGRPSSTATGTIPLDSHDEENESNDQKNNDNDQSDADMGDISGDREGELAKAPTQRTAAPGAESLADNKLYADSGSNSDSVDRGGNDRQPSVSLQSWLDQKPKDGPWNPLTSSREESS